LLNFVEITAMTPLNIYPQNDLLFGGSTAFQFLPRHSENLWFYWSGYATLDRLIAGVSHMYAGILAEVYLLAFYWFPLTDANKAVSNKSKAGERLKIH
jgi:hypothetical protein